MIFNPFSFTYNIKMDYHFDSIHHCAIIESNVLHQFESRLERLSCINSLCSLVENRGNRNFQSYAFDDIRNKCVSTHSTVTSDILTVRITNVVYFQSCQLMYCGLWWHISALTCHIIMSTCQISLSVIYVDLSDHYVDLSDNDVDLSDI